MILSPDGNPLRSMTKGNDFATHNDIHQQIVAVFGPLAQLLTEACDRIQQLEDAAGIVAPEVSGNAREYKPDSESGASIASSGDVE